MFSIIIPTFNNLEYLKLCIQSIKKNSEFNHEIIVHNNGEKEPTNTFLSQNNIKFTQAAGNIGITGGVNSGAKKATTNFIVYAHDDFYFLPGWDTAWASEIKNLKADQLTRPVTTPGGILILKVNEIKEVPSEEIDKDLEISKMIADEKNRQLSEYSILHFRKIEGNAYVKEI